MILAIDCGTTNLKIGLFDSELNRVATHATPVRYSNALRTEFDPIEIWRDLEMLIARTGGLNRVHSIALTSQAQTFTILGPNGKPRMPFLSWAEDHSTDIPVLSDFHLHCSFNVPLPQLAISKLLRIHRRNPDLLSKGSRVVFLPEFLTQKLAGVNVLDTNIAAMSGLFSLVRMEWWDEALALCNIGSDQLAKVVDLGKRNGPIVCAGNDQTAGAYGVGGDWVITLGTALAVYRQARTKPRTFHHASCWGPYPHGGYYELATAHEGCAALDWAINALYPNNMAEFFTAAGSAKPGTVQFFPSRMRTDTAWRGSSDPQSRARAVLEGMCFSVRQLIEESLLAQLTGTVRVIGGGSASPLLMQLLSNVLQYPIERGIGDSLLGAARMTILETAATKADKHKQFKPQQEYDYDTLYLRWKKG